VRTIKKPMPMPRRPVIYRILAPGGRVLATRTRADTAVAHARSLVLAGKRPGVDVEQCDAGPGTGPSYCVLYGVVVRESARRTSWRRA